MYQRLTLTFVFAVACAVVGGCAAEPDAPYGQAQLALGKKPVCAPVRGTECETRAKQLDAYAGAQSGDLACKGM